MDQKSEKKEVLEKGSKEASKNNTKEISKEKAREAIKSVAKKEGKFIKEFKEFALKGNVIDLAVGVLIGGAFQSVVTSLTNNIISMAFVIFLIVKFINKLSNIGRKNEQVVEITTKICPHCYSEVNKKADRCPHCTSELEVEEEQ